MVNAGLRAGAAVRETGELWPCLMVDVGAGQACAGALDSGAPALLLRITGAGDAPGRARARTAAAELIQKARERPGAPPIFVEIAQIEEAAVEADLDAIVPVGPAGVFLDGCRSRADVQQLSVKLAVREAEAGLAPGAVRIVAWAARTAEAAVALGGYAGASPRLAGLAFDAGALAGALCVPVSSQTVAAVRAQLVLGAAAAGVPALELAPAGDAAVRRACEDARRSGFAGVIVREARDIAAAEAAFGAAR